MVDFREYLKKRAIKAITKKKIPTPSERSSINMRKRLSRRSSEPIEPQSDCRDCEQYVKCAYDHNLNKCFRPSRVEHCAQCGIIVRYRIITTEPWKYCPICKELKHNE